jgi:hypothetical protein
MTFVLDQRLANQGSFGVNSNFDLDGTLLREEQSKINWVLLTGYYKNRLLKI